MRIGIIISTLLLLLVENITIAQIIEPKEDAILQIRYEKTVCRDTVGGKFFLTSPMVLRIGSTASMFYPEKLMFSDSMDYYHPDIKLISMEELIRDGGKAIANLKGWEDEFLFRNVHDNETFVCQNVSRYHMGYKEKTELPEWIVNNDSTIDILGYKCLFATCNYRGRNWNVWFTPEIPLKEGPWKLAGLPGLVLKAYDHSKQYVFEATSIRTHALPQVGIFVYNRKNPDILKSRQEYLKAIYNLKLRKRFMNEVALYTEFKPSKTERIPLYDLEETDYPHD